MRLFSPVGDVVVSSLPYRRGQDGVYEIELPLTLPTGFILEVTGRRGWQAQAKVAYRDAVSRGEGVLLSGGALGESAGGLISLDWRGRRPGYLAAAFP